MGVQSLKQNMRATNHKRNTLEFTSPRFLQSSASSKFISFEHIPLEVQNEKSQLFIPTKYLEQQIKMYEWRQKTELPIVKIVSFKASLSDSQKAFLDIELESFPVRLLELKDLPLFKILYLLKESIIGFERLYSKLGAFKISPKMIVLSLNNKCKVWCCENLASNSYQRTYGTQVDFLRSINSIFEQRANKLKNTSLFFIELNKFETFCQALSFIQNYARENRITISSCCKISPNQKISESPEKSFDPSMTLSKAPNFLTNPLSLTLSPKKNSRIVDEIRKQCDLEPSFLDFKRKNLLMKTSGDTAADINASKTGSFINQEELLTESLMFAEDKESKSKNTIFQKKSLFTRKYSNIEDQYKIHCYTPSLDVAPTWDNDSHHFGTNDVKFLGEDSDEEVDPEKIKNLFNTNNWKVAINGLFGSQQTMKKSFHNGKDTRKVEEHQKLLLLDRIGKDMIQSHINEGYEH